MGLLKEMIVFFLAGFCLLGFLWGIEALFHVQLGASVFFLMGVLWGILLRAAFRIMEGYEEK